MELVLVIVIVVLLLFHLSGDNRSSLREPHRRQHRRQRHHEPKQQGPPDSPATLQGCFCICFESVLLFKKGGHVAVLVAPEDSPGAPGFPAETPGTRRSSREEPPHEAPKGPVVFCFLATRTNTGWQAISPRFRLWRRHRTGRFKNEGTEESRRTSHSPPPVFVAQQRNERRITENAGRWEYYALMSTWSRRWFPSLIITVIESC
mmetsp:Transcript_15095/g.31057  ORF Transcript_15095/g.31057 Transcript_15095/m.31057 type:complete len:205 (+) Transcript_15095:1281-1895(+)